MLMDKILTISLIHKDYKYINVNLGIYRNR